MTQREQEYRNCAESVAREVFGEPNRRLSNGKQVRWGTHGSLVLNLEKGVFFDHENNEGGGVRWLLRRQLGLDEKGIDAWLSDRCYIAVDDRRANGGHPVRRKIIATYDYVDETGSADSMVSIIWRISTTWKRTMPGSVSTLLGLVVIFSTERDVLRAFTGRRGPHSSEASVTLRYSGGCPFE
jgi:hypothetical protein